LGASRIRTLRDEIRPQPGTRAADTQCMAYKSFLLVLGVLGACADAEPTTDPESPHSHDDITVSETQSEITEPEDLNPYLDPEICEPFVETEGPCSVACDPEALQEYVPDGWCMDWLCHTADGHTARIGACNWRDLPTMAPE
jgi:hypothetical protein